jgi:hypothetical protein
MKSMTYAGITKGFNGYTYSGDIKRYTLNAPFSFWYGIVESNQKNNTARLITHSIYTITSSTIDCNIESPRFIVSYRAVLYMCTCRYFESSAPNTTIGWNTSFPVEQGEGCRQPKGWPSQRCSGNLPALFFHDYDASTFKAASWTEKDFEIPEVCTGAEVVSCTAPAVSLEGQERQQYRGVLTHAAAMAGVGLNHN